MYIINFLSQTAQNLCIRTTKMGPFSVFTLLFTIPNFVELNIKFVWAFKWYHFEVFFEVGKIVGVAKQSSNNITCKTLTNLDRVLIIFIKVYGFVKYICLPNQRMFTIDVADDGNIKTLVYFDLEATGLQDSGTK